ncbi:ATP-dependent RNA helicase WM6-like [Ceratitis capitata]|uniref:ATP-dependent RNA helicase WM6-like n=1 Tax=Ceratitis capitata TaxID=7213 RepID=UPI0006188180|nr:ATP-dependent RNA helicase WM6-like [Ceratitis capitata]
MANNLELLDYEEEVGPQTTQINLKRKREDIDDTSLTVNTNTFRDFLLKPDIVRAIEDCGIDQPTELQHECLPQAMLGMDLLCQAKSGMGKTTVFVLSTLQQLEPAVRSPSTLVLCHTQKAAVQIGEAYKCFSRHMPHVKVGVFFDGLTAEDDERMLEEMMPHIVIGTPGRILTLVRSDKLNLEQVKLFIINECAQVLERLYMRHDVEELHRVIPNAKQTMICATTMLSDEIRRVCKKFVHSPLEIYENDQAKLSLRGLERPKIKRKKVESNVELFSSFNLLKF